MIDPPNTTAARNILESVNRGDVSGMSFAFRVLEDDWRISKRRRAALARSHGYADQRSQFRDVPCLSGYERWSLARSLERFEAHHRGHSIAWLRKVHETLLAR
jgi:hypothetical protein